MERPRTCDVRVTSSYGFLENWGGWGLTIPTTRLTYPCFIYQRSLQPVATLQDPRLIISCDPGSGLTILPPKTRRIHL